MDKEQVAARIRQARRETGKTLQEIATAIGVTKSTVQRYEQGRIENVKQPVLEAMARVLEVNPEWLMGRSERRVPESEVGFDDFTYALHREAQALTEENRAKLLEMARIFRAAQQADRGKKGG